MKECSDFLYNIIIGGSFMPAVYYVVSEYRDYKKIPRFKSDLEYENIKE